jgi:plastocyanin
MDPRRRAQSLRARRSLTLVAVAGVALLAAACGPGGNAADASPVATDKVDLPRSYKFAPAAITVPAGTTVTWTNSDNFTHSVDLADDPSEPSVMSPGQSVTLTFDTPGRFAYVCSFHPNDMRGVVVVTAP